MSGESVSTATTELRHLVELQNCPATLPGNFFGPFNLARKSAASDRGAAGGRVVNAVTLARCETARELQNYTTRTATEY